MNGVINTIKQRLIHNGEYKIPTQDIPLGLPKQITSMCPECRQLITATVLERDGKVVIEKKCPKHGFFDDVLNTDVELYLKCEKWTFADEQGLQRPITRSTNNCPLDCGLCNAHKSYSCLVNIDLTNKCSLRCPFCFANADASGYIYELSFEKIKELLRKAKEANYPLESINVQFSGGEPTLHPNFIDAIKYAKELGYTQIQVATNGITFANFDFLKEAKEAGLGALYLQFDGVGDEVYLKTRNAKLWDIKKKVVENCKKIGLTIALVPTIVKGVNDDQVGKIVNFAIDNIDIINVISFQPVSLTGRIPKKEREKMRYTNGDLAHDIEKQTGYVNARRDFYPLAFSTPFTRLYSYLKGRKVMGISSHSCCGLGTLLIINKNTGQIIPFTQILDVERLMIGIDKLAKEGSANKFEKYITTLKLINLLRVCYKKDTAPKELTLRKLFSLMFSINRGNYTETEWQKLFVAGMHFQDYYNIDSSRVKRCVIHQIAPNGRMYPFCTYNSGPTYREQIERQYSVPIREWKKSQGL